MNGTRKQKQSHALPHHIMTNFDIWTAAATPDMNGGLEKFLQHPKCKQSPKFHNEWGVTPFHVAATLGNLPAVMTMAEACPSCIDVQDIESGWTALHRSIYYGQYSVVAYLLKRGADKLIRDKNGMSCFELLSVCTKQESDGSRCHYLYTYGSGINFQLGHSASANAPHPKRIDRLVGYAITSVACSKFHTIALEESGVLFSWGLGTGGRLGLGNEDTISTPTEVPSSGMGVVKFIAASSFCSAAINENGQLFMWGDNRNHQIPISGSPSSLVLTKPTQVDFFRATPLESIDLSDTLAVALTKSGLVYLWGTGFHVADSVTSTPKKMVTLEKRVTKVVVSDRKFGALCENGDAFVIGKSIRKMVPPAKFPPKVRQMWKKKVIFKNICCNSSTFYMVTDAGDLYVFLEDKTIVPIIPQCRDEIVSIASSDKHLHAITQHGFLLEWKDIRNCERTIDLRNVSSVSTSNHTAALVQLSSIPNEFVFTLPSHWKDDFISMIGYRECATLCFTVNTSEKSAECETILQGFPSVHMRFPLRIFLHHAFIIPFLGKGLENSAICKRDGTYDDLPNYNVQNIPLKLLLAIIQLIYTRTVTLASSQRSIFFNALDTLGFAPEIANYLKQEYGHKTQKQNMQSDSSSIHIHLPVFAYRPVIPGHPLPFDINKEFSSSTTKGDDEHDGEEHGDSRFLNRNSFSSLLLLEKERKRRSEKQENIPAKTEAKEAQSREIVKRWDALSSEFSDIILVVEDTRIPAHRAILSSRSEYFRMMFSGSHIESTFKEISLTDLPAAPVVACLQFIYHDRVDVYPEDAFQILMVARMMLLNRLVSICEAILAAHLDPASAVALLDLSTSQNLSQLKTAVLEYITRNLAFMIDCKYAENFTIEHINDVEEYMRNTRPHAFRSLPLSFLSLREGQIQPENIGETQTSSDIQLTFVQSEAMKRLRALRKKTNQASQLIQRRERGDTLTPDQITKLEAIEEFEYEIESILEEHPILRQVEAQKTKQSNEKVEPESQIGKTPVESSELDLTEEDMELQVALMQQLSGNTSSSPQSSNTSGPRTPLQRTQSEGNANSPIEKSSESATKSNKKSQANTITPKKDPDAGAKLSALFRQIKWQSEPIIPKQPEPEQVPSSPSVAVVPPPSEPREKVSLRDIIAEEQTKKKSVTTTPKALAEKHSPGAKSSSLKQQPSSTTVTPVKPPKQLASSSPLQIAQKLSPKTPSSSVLESTGIPELDLNSNVANSPSGSVSLMQYVVPANRKSRIAKSLEPPAPPKEKESVAPWTKSPTIVPVAPVVANVKPMQEILLEEQKKKAESSNPKEKPQQSVWFKPDAQKQKSMSDIFSEEMKKKQEEEMMQDILRQIEEMEESDRKRKELEERERQRLQNQKQNGGRNRRSEGGNRENGKEQNPQSQRNGQQNGNVRRSQSGQGDAAQRSGNGQSYASTNTQTSTSANTFNEEDLIFGS